MGKHNWIAGVTALLLVGGLGACSRVSPQDLEAARQAGAAEASRSTAEEKAKADKARLEKDVEALKKQAAAAAAKPAQSSPSGGGTSRTSGSSGSNSGTVGSRNCGGTVTANSATSCSFALTVASDWQANGGGNAAFWSYSTVTNKPYWMRCSAGVVTVCRGGNGAAVYIR
ncbi:MAG TPA: hypothetical protein VES01_06895 [Dermatophilaceae bacterium]|nr:hypothetical protein [Dermatophilaceae bacterium]